MTDTVTTNQYITIRTMTENVFFVNTINYDGSVETSGEHRYFHRRSARRAAIELAKKLDVSYRQDLEYSGTPYAFTAMATA